MALQIKKLPDFSGDFENSMHGSGGTGFPLVKDGKFAADLIRFQPGKGIPNHVHPGDHILICIGGTGWLVFDGERHRLEKDIVYLVPGTTPHAIETTLEDSELTLISVANDHRLVSSIERSEIL